MKPDAVEEVKRVYPCHSKPRTDWCDHSGPGGFMGHTCVPLPRPVVDYEVSG